MRIAFAALRLLPLVALTLPLASEAQYFGRNKVQYEDFDWRLLETDHFTVHFYPEERPLAADAARMAERWYARHSDLLRHTFDRKPLIFYANHPDFQQTNVIGGFIGQGTGGVTESIRNRVIMPFTGVYADNDHVLGHELVHVFQYDMANAPNGGGLRGMNSLPLWLVEGMAEYLSVGRDDPHTAMWLRDAALRNDLPSIRQLTTDPRYFPYRYGQALWAYIGGRWGDPVIGQLYRESVRRGWEPAVQRVLGVTSDSLSAQWLASIRAAYLPLMAGRQRPGEVGARVLRREGEDGEMDLSPALSPDGRYVAFFTRRGVFGIDLYVAETATGRVVRRLTGPNTDTHFDAISFMSSSGGWSPDGSRLAIVVEAQGDEEIVIFNVPEDRRERRIRAEGVGAISGPSWSPDGTRIVFSGTHGGISDLYVADVASGRVEQLTDDRHADLHPAWSPDGRTIAFASDRGAGTDFDRLTYSAPVIALLDVASRGVRVLRALDGSKHVNPQWSPDGRSLYFISDYGGFQDVYRLAIADGSVYQVTRLATGVSGITYLSPAISVASRSGDLAFTVFEDAGYSLYRLDAASAQGTPIPPAPVATLADRRGGVPGLSGATSATGAGTLPPRVETGNAVVSRYLADATTGLLPAGTTFPERDYRPSLSLEYVGSPGVGVGIGPTGAAFGGGVATYFADMLNNHVAGADLALQGQSFKDAGGQLFYLNQRRRWNWMASLSHVPYLSGGAGVADTVLTLTGVGEVPAQIVEQVFLRQYIDQASAMAQYPFSQTRRFEASVTATRIGYDYDVERLYAVQGQTVARTESDPDAPDPLTYAQGSLAFVGDFSTFGFTSPVAGGRWRLEYTPTFGTVTFQSLLADYRRYLYTGRLATLALRGLHYGRYGRDAENYDLLSPLYLGNAQFVRGYDVNSFGPEDCTTGIDGGDSCPEFTRLIGSRIAVASAELRLPLFGSREFGLLNFPWLPTEVSPFVDAGIAWGSEDAPVLELSRTSTARIPVFSAGVSARMNLLGYAVLEVFWAYPFQRPGGGGQWGFQLAPGW